MSQYDPFQNPRKTNAPTFATVRKGLNVAIPYDPSIPLNDGYNEYALYQEFQTIYGESQEGLIWISREPNSTNRKAFSKDGVEYYEHVVPYSHFQI
jgi:hypothetical protein